MSSSAEQPTAAIRISVVYLNFNRLDETRQTTLALEALVRGREDIEVVAVDNASRDGTREFLASQHRWLLPVLLDVNQGIAGYNRGFEEARGEYLFVLDDDSCPADTLCLDRASEILDRHPAVGMVAADILNPDGSRQWSWLLPLQRKAGDHTGFVGCGFLIRRGLFAKIGWYPEDFFLYQNEVEVAFQIRLAGFRIYFDPDCRVVHRALISTRPGYRRVFFATRNTLWLLRRYGRFPSKLYYLSSRLLIGLANALRFRQLNAYMQAVRSGLREPIEKTPLPGKLRRDFAPFWRQNSLFHQVFTRFP